MTLYWSIEMDLKEVEKLLGLFYHSSWLKLQNNKKLFG